MDYRHELKYQINYADLLTLRMRLRAVMEPDPHAVDGRYGIRSLYFDTPSDKALREKLDGVSRREKFRLRLYNGNTDLIHLEKKSKWNGLGNKRKAPLQPWEIRCLLEGDTDWMQNHPHSLVRELYAKMQMEGLRPKTIVEYTREPFLYPPGNVRVTLDYGLRTGLGCAGFLDADCVTIPAGESPALMEVKWDQFLPGIIRDAVQLPGRRMGAFSKYAQCRIYG